jgi:hypothetical protein
LAGTFQRSNYLVTVKQHPSKVHRPHSLHQVEQVAFDALLRKMPDIIIDFSSVVPVQFSAIFLSFCDELSGFARREHSHDAGARVDFHRESAGAADIFQEFTWAVHAVVLECACDICAYAQVI